MNYIYLAIAIVTEVIGTSALKATEGFTKFWPSFIVVVSYALSFYYLAIVLKHFPIGITYAIWSGAGIVLVAAIGFFWYRQTPDFAAVIGMGLIIAGVIVIHAFSKAVSS